MQTAVGPGSAFPKNSPPHQPPLLDGSSSPLAPSEVSLRVLPAAGQEGAVTRHLPSGGPSAVCSARVFQVKDKPTGELGGRNWTWNHLL